MSAEVEEPLPQSYTWTAAEISFAESDEAGQNHNEVCGYVMRLQVVEVQDGTEESARGKTETASKMSKEDDSLTGSCLGHYLVAGDAPLDLGRHLAGSDEGLDGDGRCFGPLPARAGGLGEIRSGSLHWSLKQEEIEEK